MNLFRLETIGAIDGLGIREEAIPVASAGEVLIRVKASALNFRDLAIVLGKSPFAVRAGVVPVSDAAGEVQAVGPGDRRCHARPQFVNCVKRDL